MPLGCPRRLREPVKGAAVMSHPPSAWLSAAPVLCGRGRPGVVGGGDGAGRRDVVLVLVARRLSTGKKKGCVTP